MKNEFCQEKYSWQGYSKLRDVWLRERKKHVPTTAETQTHLPPAMLLALPIIRYNCQLLFFLKFFLFSRFKICLCVPREICYEFGFVIVQICDGAGEGYWPCDYTLTLPPHQFVTSSCKVNGDSATLLLLSGRQLCVRLLMAESSSQIVHPYRNSV